MDWHLDGYDKFKPSGFEIHGFINVYSRHVLWLNILRSNKDPKEVCNLFDNYLAITKEVQRKVLADRGTENVLITDCQEFLRNYGVDSAGQSSFFSASLLPLKK